MDILRLQSTNGGLLLYLDNDNPSGWIQIRPKSGPLGALSRLRQSLPDFLCKALVDSIVRILVSVKLTILVALVPTCLFITTKKRIAMTLTSRCARKEVRKGYNVLGVFYGHPGVFVNSSHRAIALAREEGFKAKMLAGVSAEDCLFADLEFDPAILGCMTCEASECLTRDRPFNPFIHNIIWQVGSIGIANMTFNNDKFSILVDCLEKDFGPNHSRILCRSSPIKIAPKSTRTTNSLFSSTVWRKTLDLTTVAYYVGRVLPQAVSKIETFTVADLRKAEVQSHFDVASTLYVPPRDTGPVDPDHVVPEGHRILQGSPAMKTFLMDLALKPRLLEEYRENPAAVVDRVDGLTEDEKYGLELGTEGPVYALMSRTAEDVSSGKKLSRSDLLGGKPTAFVGLVVILAVVV
ncbi:uroporphyrin-iii c tetrapyrrole (corrin porphyrin) methyltransferase [Moniliophthora roreri]|nr:uroporphyrin-iii c tetrapyrrole (corrin porphyrin) methyltransferase [Moniliophthora roreri]